MIQTIKFTKFNDGMYTVALDDKVWNLRLYWNPQGFWTFGIYDAYFKPIVANIKIVPYIYLTKNKHCFDIPSGDFAVASNKEEIGYNDFKDGKAILVYTDEY